MTPQWFIYIVQEYVCNVHFTCTIKNVRFHKWFKKLTITVLYDFYNVDDV